MNPPPRLIETLLWNEGYPLLKLHLARLAASARELGYRFEDALIRGALAYMRVPVVDFLVVGLPVTTFEMRRAALAKCG